MLHYDNLNNLTIDRYTPLSNKMSIVLDISLFTRHFFT